MAKCFNLELLLYKFRQFKNKKRKQGTNDRIKTLYKSILFLIFGIINIFFSFPQYVIAQENKHETIKLQLRWDNQFQFAGYYASEWKGYYREEGLNVEILPALKSDGTILSATKEVSEGRADFGIGAADILIANDNGADLKVTAVIFQQSAARFYLKTETPYSFIADLANLKIARNVNDLIDIELQAALINEGIDPKKIKAYHHSPRLDNLVSDEVQVVPGYKLSLPFIANDLGLNLKEIKLSNYGVDFYGDSLFVNGKLVKKNPDVVEKFVRASLRGWEYALTHTEEIAYKIDKELINALKIDKNLEFNLYQAKIIKELTLYPIVEIGHINPYRWEKMHSFLNQIGLVKKDLNVDTFIFNPNRVKAERDKNIKRFFVWALLLILFLLIIIFIWIYFLKKLVNMRTKELKENEARFRSVFQNTNDTICVLKQGIVFLANNSFTTMFGYTPKEFYGRSVIELTTPEFRELITNNIRKRFNKEKVQDFYDIIGIRKDGTLFNVEAKVSVFEQEGETYTIAIMRDVTESKKSKEELKKEKDKAERMSITKSEFIANMSHELRTPLNVNIAAIQLFESYIKNTLYIDKEKIAKHLKAMSQNCFRLLRLVNNLIDTTKIDAGFYEPHFGNCDIISVIENIALSVADYAKQKHINLIFDTDTEELMMLCDVDMIERIMLNIISNAIKFTYDCVDIDIYNKGDIVVIRIKDNGIGIETENQSIIFERYKQVENLFTRQNEGTGIGLALTKSLVEMHGGNIRVESEPGKGSSFIIELPIKQNISEEVEVPRVIDDSYKDKLIEKMNVEFSDIYKTIEK